MPKERPNPLLRGPKRKAKDRPRRSRRKAQPLMVKVQDVHCLACKNKYELGGSGEVKYCIWCASDQIKVSIRMRKATTPEERIQHDLAAGLRTARLVAELFAGLFGFHPNPNDWTPQQPPGMRPPNNELEAELMKEGYKKLAMKYHPDKGGDPEKMKELNRLKEKLGL